MKRENIIKAFAGSMVLGSAVLGYFYSPYWLFVAMFVGANLLQYAFTNWCLLETLLKKRGIGEE